MENKRIAIVTYEYPPVIGGAGIYAQNLFEGLKNKKHLVSLFLLAPKTKFNNAFLKKILEVIYIIRSFFTLYSVFNKKFDIVIINDGRAKKIYALIYKFLDEEKVKKSIFIMHGSEINTYFNKPSSIMKLLNIPSRLKQIFPKLKTIIVVSESEYSQWVSFMPKLSKNIKIIPHAISSKQFYPKSKEEKKKIRKKLNISDDDFVIFSASRIVQNKGQDTIINALNLIKNNVQNIKLLIAGNGCYLDSLKSMVCKNNIQDMVVFCGAINRIELVDYYNIADIFVLPSRYIESFGLVYIEAFACETPVISSNLGGVNDIVTDNVNGYKISPNDADKLGELILKLNSDRKLLNTLSKNAFEKFSLFFEEERMIKNIIDETN